MRLRLKRTVLPALLCLWSGIAAADSDPFDTEAALPLKPALRLDGAVGDPCADAMPQGALNLPDVVNLALCNNPQTREVWASSRVQAAQVGASRGSFLPGASLSASGNRNSPGASQRTLGLSLSYLLYDFGVRAANLENARQLLAAASATQDSTVQAVFLSAVQAYYQTHATQAVLDAAREAERAAKGSFAAAEARYLAGSATPADKLQAQTAYSQATLNRIAAEGNLKKAIGELANIIGLEANRNVTLAAANAEAVPAGFEQDVNALIEEAKRHRPDLIAAEAQVKAAEASAAAARAAGKPSISLTASTTQLNTAGVTSRGSSLGVSVSMPLFAGYAPTYRVRAAEAQVVAQQARTERVRLQVALDVWNAWQNLVTATQSLRTTADLLGSATQSERVALGRYQAGVGSILDLLNAQSALASARQQRIQSQLDWNVGRAALAQSMGSLDANLLQTLSPERRAEQGLAPRDSISSQSPVAPEKALP
ncbi:MAG: transporter [Gallionellales bacterium GWA2_60_142]|nr:MAG: transporter [Gallionellales bacterium GWA2_60_142]HCI15177.1 TolC family protein [Gallionellaceae bacterium]